MPVKKSALKALRQSKVRQTRNSTRKRAVKKVVKTTVDAIQKKSDDAVKQVQAAYKAIDKAVQKGALHKKTADRRKARLMKRLNDSSKV